MKTLNTADLSPAELQNYLQYAIAPRPICLASTIDRDGNVNLSPFSFFNMFSTNPPVCIFSPARRVRDNTTKHTLENLREVPECVINVVTYDIVHQVSLSSVEYEKGINEFVKSGLTAVDSDMVKPPRVAESPVQFECVVTQIISLGGGAGAGNLVLAEIKRIHLKEEILNNEGTIDQMKMDLVARLGGDWYCRVMPENLFVVPKPNRHIGIGFDQLPENIRNSAVLTGNDLGQLANATSIPEKSDVKAFLSVNPELGQEINRLLEKENAENYFHKFAQELLHKQQTEKAWMILSSLTYNLV